ncbi:cytochrome d ubiquinol oxidase subunit II [Streptomyces sp. NPDC048172]|uniref:cytochrome d ubiquinol oxidase subunit II n=1 Tax=Streptomyces sp. NPDC048172 TaxID=3365505 RepID=UPI003720C1EB
MTTLETVWLALLGLLLAGYFVLGGYDYGVQMLGPRLDGTAPRGGRDTVAAMGPFFLGNEVWLVAFAGVMFGAFPHLEGHLLSGLYPLFVAILLGLVLGGAAVQLRGRSHGARGARLWDALLVLGGALPALCWGLVLGLLTRGVPRRDDGSFHVGPAEVLHPYVLACGLTAVLLFAAHGATFLALRGGPGPALADRARRTARTLLRATAVATAVPPLLTLAGAGASLTHPGAAAVLLALFAVALAAARWALAGRGAYGRAFAASSCAALLPVPLLGAGQYPYVLAARGGGGITVGDAAADEVTLRTLLAFGVVLVPVILAYQTWSWWVFRGRTGLRHPRYF